ncbi:putative choline kinase [Aspergillus homomorphus CBS 101889]|uniref:Choline kinase n=1 Tax=Aspergillus homomorphus (strain CBS 101889) TaxID=1450537 RepID=A0A395I942_ASPHC|nr:choline kinase [Aspergillus homomorphus CBS 101889]RAL15578.1 choline kinase [Aspergillus homomorphus CBS 101889]
MPSFTGQTSESGLDYDGPQPIMGTGLNVAFQRRRRTTGHSDSATSSEAHIARQRAPVAKKATARPPIHLPTSLGSQSSSIATESAIRDEKDHSTKYSEEDPQNSLYSQVYEWLEHEKSKRSSHYSLGSGVPDEAANLGQDAGSNSTGILVEGSLSSGTNVSMALDKLEKILLQYAASRQDGPVRRLRRHRSRGLRRGSASESDFSDLDTAAPSVDAVLDNSKTMAYSGGGGGAEDDDSEHGANSRHAKDREVWTAFKTEILRLAHTLQFKGWRKLPMDFAADIDVIRLSGALTNAVYVVNPPQSIPVPKAEDGSYSLVPRKAPSKLLLRIYGPQADHLIDRENELQILRRLGRKNIGPKVLGTFQNGRFEEYFEARPLTPKELRDPLTMKQIAKRMRELHDGVELLAEEREGGPMVFKNWDKWVDRCEQVINWLDKEIQSEHSASKSVSESWRRRGFVCGVPWPVFRRAVDSYRKWLISSCGGVNAVKQQLVFAHNDTQYGNLLRMEPSHESPLLRPENKHKQLVVIDFEYASANTPGFEFANHFSEWCYNYHDPERPWACNNTDYPTPAQQHQFISAYLSHRPGLREQASPSITPLMRAGSSNTTSLAPLSLDAGPDMDVMARVDIEKTHADGVEAKIQALMDQTKLWRVITSAQWVAWGIVQAKVPGMEEGIKADAAASNGHGDTANGNGAHVQRPTDAPTSTPPVDADVDEADEFDYLAYAQDRAMFFWSDLLSMGFVQEDELPAPLVEQIKSRIIKY